MRKQFQMYLKDEQEAQNLMTVTQQLDDEGVDVRDGTKRLSKAAMVRYLVTCELEGPTRAELFERIQVLEWYLRKIKENAGVEVVDEIHARMVLDTIGNYAKTALDGQMKKESEEK